MIIEKLELENFGPFYGNAEVVLGGDSRPIVVLHGDNMSGKTSILNAIRWALYGVAKDRLGNAIPTRKLINRDAYDERQYRISVRLHISTSDAGGKSKFVLRRQKRARRSDQEPVTEDQFEDYLDIDHDGNVVHASEFADIVADLLPEGISRFFLFDGELLQEYEELVRDGGEKSAAAVKESIEMILGVPAVTKGRDDFQVLSNEVGKRLRAEARHNAALQEATEKSERLEAERKDLKDEVQTLEEQRKNASVELAGLEDILKESAKLREDAGALRTLRRTVSDLESDAVRKKEERRASVRELWRDALTPVLRQKVTVLADQRDQAYDALNKLWQAESRLRQVEKSASNDTCPECGQVLPAATLEKLRAETHDLQALVADLRDTADEDRYKHLTAVTERLREISPANVAPIVVSLETDLKTIATRKYKTEQQIRKIEERLRDQDPEKALEYERKRDEYVKLLQTLKHKIEGLESQIEEKTREIDAATRLIQQHQVPALQTYSRQLDLVRDVESIFEASLDDLIRELKTRVESEATDIFKQITTDSTYSGLKINENYGLTIVDANGRDVEVRSAGAEQVVALSLIGALNRLAVKRGPVIMDTPFGRLDPKHRAKILKFVPTLSDQVVLLVHEGEVDSQRDLDPIASRIARKYEILHPTSTRSEIVPAQGVSNG